MRERCVKMLSSIFSVVFTVCLILALFAGAGFVAAFLIGGEMSVALCAVLNMNVLPAIYIAGAAMALLGVVKMYFAGEKMFFLELKGRKKAEH